MGVFFPSLGTARRKIRQRVGRRNVGWMGAVALAAAWNAVGMAATDRVPLALSPRPDGPGEEAIELSVTMPGRATAYLIAPPAQWRTFQTLEFEIAWPADAPADAQVLVHMMDWDYNWFQWLAPNRPRPGTTTRFVVDLAPGAAGWTPVGHFGAWQFRTLMEPREFAIRVFGDGEGTTAFGIKQALARRRSPDDRPPQIRRLRANADGVPVYGKFELKFDLPDRYECPFDPDEIAVRATFTRPDGTEEAVEGFFAQDYLRQVTPAGERYVPQGPSYWAVRYAPRVVGVHRYRLSVRDARGEATWGPGEFEARPARQPGYVRVAARDPRYFEFDDGRFFFPLGHNIRSPFDVRHDREFAWQQRFPEGPAAYERHFRRMAAHRANFAEIWFAAWSLGLEWRSGWEGYHGIGQYHLLHAWQMDRVIEEAERHGIYLNLVIHNHGKYSDWVDPEWNDNPFNVALGGYLEKPDDFFTDPRARRDFLRLMRYKIARWGHSPHVFAWELWSELDLAGSKDRQPRPHQRPEVIEWHQSMGSVLREMDIYGHLRSTHVSGEYTQQNPALVKIPELDLAAIDAYHGNPDPLFIVDLLRRSAEFNNPLGKPVLVTEFGGSWRAQQGVRHVADAFFAGIWSSMILPLGGSPLFWWWHLIEEENYYPVYEAAARFLDGEDRRDPALVFVTPEIRRGTTPSSDPAAVVSASPTRALGWVYRSRDFSTVDPNGPPTCADAEVRLPGFQDGAYEVEFWNTQVGRRQASATVKADAGVLAVRVPPFARDIAFKIRPAAVAE